MTKVLSTGTGNVSDPPQTESLPMQAGRTSKQKTGCSPN